MLFVAAPFLGRYMRRGREADEFYQLTGAMTAHEFDRGRIAHVKMPCLDQEIYGVPEYLGALQSALRRVQGTGYVQAYLR